MLLIQDWMLVSSLIEKAVEQARMNNVPRPVTRAMMQTKERIDKCKIKAPDELQVAFQERFHRNEVRALEVAMGYARKWMERDEKALDEATAKGFEALQEKLRRYMDEMDAATEMRSWFDDGVPTPRIIPPRRSVTRE